MVLGALIGAYQEDDSGGLRALLPLSGRTLLEYQVRCASSAGAAPIVVVVTKTDTASKKAITEQLVAASQLVDARETVQIRQVRPATCLILRH